MIILTVSHTTMRMLCSWMLLFHCTIINWLVKNSRISDFCHFTTRQQGNLSFEHMLAGPMTGGNLYKCPRNSPPHFHFCLMTEKASIFHNIRHKSFALKNFSIPYPIKGSMSHMKNVLFLIFTPKPLNNSAEMSITILSKSFRWGNSVPGIWVIGPVP